MNRITFAITYLVTSSLLLLSGGCGNEPQSDAALAKRPRPVEVRVLHRAPPPTSSLVTAAVASWKTQEIGFEVSGRVEWVAEPNTSLEGRLVDSAGDVLTAGTPIAGIESEHYQLQVDSAKAELARAQQQVTVAKIELEKSLPSQKRAAEADRKLALTELDRSKRLNLQNAGSQADVDRADANLQTAISKIEQLDASLNAKVAEIESLRFQVKQAEQALRDSERNLEDCTLYSSFSGQIAAVSVVPGSVVSSGQAVATVQMMNPIKIEVEVSAADSRRLRKRQRLPLQVMQPDGSLATHDGFLYLVDPVADPSTRTFTLTLLMMNEKTSMASAADQDASIATSDQAWQVAFSFLPGAEQGVTFAIENAIHQDATGHFVWRINNIHANEPLPPDRLAKVSKLRVKLGKTKLPFLGNWQFQQILIDEEDFDTENDLIVGKLTGPEEQPADWNGDTVLIDRSSQWLVRPGDLVKVDLSSGSNEPGFYVPMDAIAHETDHNYLFLIDESSAPTTVRRVPVTVTTASKDSAVSSLRRIESADDDVNLEGMRYVSQGAHYLINSEPVKLIESPVARSQGAAQ